MMRTKTRKKAFLLMIVLIGWMSGYTQERLDSLYNYLEMAIKNNPAVLQRFAEYKATMQKIPQVGSLPDPEASLGVFLKPMELVGGNQVADIQLMQMFPWFGVLRHARDEMSLMANAKYELFRDAKLQVSYDVLRTWYDLNKIKRNIDVSEKNLDLLRTLERLALVRFKAGTSSNGSASSGSGMSSSPTSASSAGSSGMNTMGGGANSSGIVAPSLSVTPPSGKNSMGGPQSGGGLSDVYRIQIEIGDLQNSISQLQNQYLTTAAQFNSYLNRSQSAMVSIPDSLVIEKFDLSQIAVSDTIRENNPMVKMLQFEQKSLEARKQMVTKMSYPMVGIGLNYTLVNKNPMSTASMNGKDMIMPEVKITLPIYRKKYKAMRDEADWLKEANSQNLKGTANNLQNDYYLARQLYDDAQRRVKLYTHQYQLASQSLDILIKSFTTSGSSLTDLLRVRQQLLEYSYRKVEAVADYNTAVAWLKRLMGTLQSEN